MCRLVGKDKNVTAGLGVFAREEYHKFETVGVMDKYIVPAKDTNSTNILTRPDGQRVYAQGPSTSYAGYINDPKNEALENCEVVCGAMCGVLCRALCGILRGTVWNTVCGTLCVILCRALCVEHCVGTV